MISSVGIVLLICAVAVNAQSQCTFVQKGETNGVAYKLDPVYLQPGARDYKVNIPPTADSEDGSPRLGWFQDIGGHSGFVDYISCVVFSIFGASISNQVAMISSVGIVLLICAVAVNAQSQCTFVQKGETNGVAYKLDPVYLQPGTRDYKVNIP
ncbi:hypothetical protein HW555_003930, partial [Spodoptera exigua]